MSIAPLPVPLEAERPTAPAVSGGAARFLRGIRPLDLLLWLAAFFATP